MFLNNLFLGSPFEQFDSVTWVAMDYILESKTQIDEYLFYSTTPEVSAVISESKVSNVRFYLLVFYIFISIIVFFNLNKDLYNTVKCVFTVYLQDFSFIFFFLFFFFITGGFITIWFADTSVASNFIPEFCFDYMYASPFIGQEFVDYMILPQINIALLIDENLISFFLAFFYLVIQKKAKTKILF